MILNKNSLQGMKLLEAKLWLSDHYVFHPAYQPQPQHSSYALVDVRLTCARVRHRMRQQKSFTSEVEKAKQKLRLIHGRVAG